MERVAGVVRLIRPLRAVTLAMSVGGDQSSSLRPSAGPGRPGVRGAAAPGRTRGERRRAQGGEICDDGLRTWPGLAGYPDRSRSRLDARPVPSHAASGSGSRPDRAATADRQPERAGEAGLAKLPSGLGWPGGPRAAVPPRAADHGAADGGAAYGGAPTVVRLTVVPPTTVPPTTVLAGRHGRTGGRPGGGGLSWPAGTSGAGSGRAAGSPAGAVSRGTGIHSGGRHPGWPDDKTGQESETAMAEGRAWTSADQEAAGGGLETDSGRSLTGRARHAGPDADLGSQEAGAAGPAGSGSRSTPRSPGRPGRR